MVGEANSDGEDGDFSGIFDRNDEMTQLEALEQEAEILMTQAAQRGRVWNEPVSETSEDRASRIASMKQRMPCNACCSHGKVVFGHWHSDKEWLCYEESKKKKEKGAFLTEHDQEGETEGHAAFGPDVPLLVSRGGTGARRPLLRPPGRQPLARVDEEPAHLGDGDVGDRCPRGQLPDRRDRLQGRDRGDGRGPEDSCVSAMQRVNGAADQSVAGSSLYVVRATP